MPLARYFLYVGGVLLTLVFLLDACLTDRLPEIERLHAGSPVIRIHSDRKWPERIVFDTTLSPIVSTHTAIEEHLAAGPATVADVSVKAGEREAFALMQPSDVKRLEPTEPKRRELKAQRRKIVKRHVTPRSVLLARQQQFGWFGNTIW